MLANKTKVNWGILSRPECGITHRACRDAKQPIDEVSGPLLEASCKHVCMACVKLLERNKIPLPSLTNGTWMGAVPPELLELSYAEKLLVAWLRPNYCIVRVESGVHRMHANAVLVPNPTSKIYAKLPPHRDDLDDVMAFVFTRPTQLTQKDLCWTPFLVQYQKVTAALQWNHCDYSDSQNWVNVWCFWTIHWIPLNVKHI